MKNALLFCALSDQLARSNAISGGHNTCMPCVPLNRVDPATRLLSFQFDIDCEHETATKSALVVKTSRDRGRVGHLSLTPNISGLGHDKRKPRDDARGEKGTDKRTRCLQGLI